MVLALDRRSNARLGSVILLGGGLIGLLGAMLLALALNALRLRLRLRLSRPSSKEVSSSDAPAPVQGVPKRLTTNMISNYAATAVAGVASLLTTPILIHHLGLTAYGVWAVVLTMSGYLALADLGFGAATTKIVSEHAGRRDDLVIQTFNTNFWCLCLLGLLALGAGLGLALVVPDIFHIPPSLRHQSVTAFRLLAVMTALALPGGAFLGVLAGYQRFDLVSLSFAANGVAAAAVSIAIALAGGGLVALSIGRCAASVGLVVIPAIMVRRLVPTLRISPRLMDRTTLRRTTSLSSWYSVGSLASVMGGDLDLFVVGGILGVRAVAVFSVASQLSQVASKVVGVLSQAFFPHISSLSKEGDREGMRSTMTSGTRLVILFSLPVNLVLIILAAPLVHAWVGRGVKESAAVLIWFGAEGAVGALTTVAWQVLPGVGQARRAAVIAIVYAALDLAVSVALARPLGPPGVALGGLIGLTLLNLPLIVGSSLKVVGTSAAHWARVSVLPHLPAAVATTLALVGVRFVLSSHRPVVAAVSVGAFIFYVGVYLVTGCPKEDRRAIAVSVRRRLGQIRT